MLKELGLQDFSTEWVAGYQTEFDSIFETERMDAEYFQPKYEEVKRKIRAKKYNILGGLISHLKKGVEVGSEAYQEEGVPFMRVSNIGSLEINQSNGQFISHELFKELKEKYHPKEGEILLSKDGTPGIAYYLNESMQTIISGGIVRLKTENLEPEYLTLVINSPIVQSQIEQEAGGALIKHWRPDQIKNTLIPILEPLKRTEIVKMIQDSFKALTESRQLLEQAKKEVEEMIEKASIKS